MWRKTLNSDVLRQYHDCDKPVGFARHDHGGDAGQAKLGDGPAQVSAAAVARARSAPLSRRRP